MMPRYIPSASSATFTPRHLLTPSRVSEVYIKRCIEWVLSPATCEHQSSNLRVSAISLLMLPAEIRLMIYRLVFSPMGYLQLVNSKEWPDFCFIPIDAPPSDMIPDAVSIPRLHHTCRQIYHEARNIIHDRNTVVAAPWALSEPLFRCLGATQTNHIRHIWIKIDHMGN